MNPSYAYVEFAEPEHIDAALAMDNSLFKGRLLKASDNLPSILSSLTSQGR
jgi:RNA recognition motif-containing protein